MNLLRVTYLGYRGCEDNHFVELADTFHELVNTGALDHVDIVIVALDLNGNREIGLVKYLRMS